MAGLEPGHLDLQRLPVELRAEPAHGPREAQPVLLPDHRLAEGQALDDRGELLGQAPPRSAGPGRRRRESRRAPPARPRRRPACGRTPPPPCPAGAPAGPAPSGRARARRPRARTARGAADRRRRCPPPAPAASARAAAPRPRGTPRPVAPRSRSQTAGSARDSTYSSATRAGEVANTADVGGALRHRDRPARVKQVEGVRALEHLVVRGERQAPLDEPAAFLLVLVEAALEHVHGRFLEVVDRPLALVLPVDVRPRDAGRPLQLEGAPLVLKEHGQPLEPVGDLGRDQIELEAAELLEVRELRHLHAVDPDLPPEPPGAERRAFPVVLDEAHVVLSEVDSHGLERGEVAIENVRRRRLQNDLVLVVAAGSGTGSRRSARRRAGSTARRRRSSTGPGPGSAGRSRD